MTLVRDHGGWVTPQHICPRAPYFTPLRGKEQGRLFLAEALGRQHSVWLWKPSLMMAIPLWGTVSLVSDLQGTGHFLPGPRSACLTLTVLPALHLSCQSQPGLAAYVHLVCLPQHLAHSCPRGPAAGLEKSMPGIGSTWVIVLGFGPILLCVSPQGCWKKVSQIGGLTPREMYSLTVIEVRSLKWRCCQGYAFSPLSKEECFLASS